MSRETGEQDEGEVSSWRVDGGSCRALLAQEATRFLERGRFGRPDVQGFLSLSLSIYLSPTLSINLSLPKSPDMQMSEKSISLSLSVYIYIHILLSLSLTPCDSLPSPQILTMFISLSSHFLSLLLAVYDAWFIQISDDMKPHPIVAKILAQLCKFVPKWKIIPTQDIIDAAIKSPQRRMEVLSLSLSSVFHINHFWSLSHLSSISCQSPRLSYHL